MALCHTKWVYTGTEKFSFETRNIRRSTKKRMDAWHAPFKCLAIRIRLIIVFCKTLDVRLAQPQTRTHLMTNTVVQFSHFGMLLCMQCMCRSSNSNMQRLCCHEQGPIVLSFVYAFLAFSTPLHDYHFLAFPRQTRTAIINPPNDIQARNILIMRCVFRLLFFRAFFRLLPEKLCEHEASFC